MEENGLVAMVAAKKSASVTLELSLIECVTHHACLHQVQIRLPTLALKPRGDVTKSPKKGLLSGPTKALMSLSFKNYAKTFYFLDLQ